MKILIIFILFRLFRLAQEKIKPKCSRKLMKSIIFEQIESNKHKDEKETVQEDSLEFSEISYLILLQLLKQ